MESQLVEEYKVEVSEDGVLVKLVDIVAFTSACEI